MQRFLLLLLIIYISIKPTQAQNIPTNVVAPVAAIAKKLPLGYSSVPLQNYVREFVPQVPITDSSVIRLSTMVDSVVTFITYFDSYGRNVETISKQTSPNKKDNVVPSTYDEFGRSAIIYMPYTALSNDGLFKTNPFQEDSTFYKTQFPTEQIYYSHTLGDGSPLDITTKSLPPGNSWGGAGKGKSYGHRSNTLSDSVVLWTIANNNEDDFPVKSGFYLSATLTVKEGIDEDNVKSIEYINERGQIVLAKTQIANSPGSAHIGWLCTYYIYNDIGELRSVIPPKAVEAINNSTLNWNFTSSPAIYTDLCYAYFYDDRGRCIAKRIPGKGKLFTAFDLYNRVVMTQDPKLNSLGKWAFSLYDSQGRSWKSGIISTSLAKDTIIAQAARSISYPNLSGIYTITSENYYDNYEWVAGSGSGLSSTLTTTDINSTNFITSHNTSPDFARQITSSLRIRGNVTGSKSIILNSVDYLYNVNFFNSDGVNIQTAKQNYSGGIDIQTVQNNYSGWVLRSHMSHNKGGLNSQSHKLLSKNSYDHVGRLKSITKNLDGLGDKTIVQTNFGELGNVNSMIIGGGLETQNFAYNIRGWITGINKDHVNNINPSAYFGEIISYDYGFGDNQFTGQKAGIKWRSAGDSTVRAYGYSYDNASRLTNANYSQQNTNGSNIWTKDKMDFTASNLTYDANGNILSMSQQGMQIAAISLIDSLKYQYFSNSNWLQKVSDLSTGGGFMGDFKDSTSSGDDYTYDVNGNIDRDNNRHMHTTSNGAGAVFNMLDKIDSIVIAGKATTYYYYDANGEMIGQRTNTYTSTGKTVKNYQYLGGFVYLNDTLQYTLIEGGRIRYAKKNNNLTGATYYGFEYDYFITDHMGNVRTVLTEGRDTSTYKATMETANQTVEDALFANEYTPVNTIVNKPSGFDSDGANAKVSKLNGNVNKVGPSLVLKVMAGDNVQLSSYAFYNTTTQPAVGGINLLSDILSVLAGGVVNNSPGKLVSGNTTAVSTALSPNVNNFLLNNRSYDNTKPKAYLNWVFFDNQFNFVPGNSGVLQVQPGSNKQVLAPALQTMAKNGYLYVFVSNESGQDVYFDDITIKHTTGPLIQEQTYYPYGLEIQALSDKAMMKGPVNYKYNAGSILEDEDGISYYNTFFRKYDAQIGRFTSVDIESGRYYSLNPYQFAANNPISNNDPLGDKIVGSGNSQVMSYGFEMGNGRMQRGPDGNYHVGWMSGIMWTSAYFGDKFWETPSSSGGGGFGAAIYKGLASDFGGKWTDGKGYSNFQSDQAAFGWGLNYLNSNGLWGQNGFAMSAEHAQQRYIFYGGKDGDIIGGNYLVTIYGSFKNGRWQTSKVSYLNQSTVETDVRNLIANKKYDDAINMIIAAYPSEMGKARSTDKFGSAAIGGYHVTHFIQDPLGTYTLYSTDILDMLTKKAVSFGLITRTILHERVHMMQFQGGAWGNVGAHGEIDAYYLMLKNSKLPGFDQKNFKADAPLINHFKETAQKYFLQLSPGMQSQYIDKMNFIKNYK